MNQIHPQAQLAIKAAKGFYSWGHYAYRRFVQKNNIHPKLLRIARNLEAQKRIGVI